MLVDNTVIVGPGNKGLTKMRELVVFEDVAIETALPLELCSEINPYIDCYAEFSFGKLSNVQSQK